MKSFYEIDRKPKKCHPVSMRRSRRNGLLVQLCAFAHWGQNDAKNFGDKSKLSLTAKPERDIIKGRKDQKLPQIDKNELGVTQRIEGKYSLSLRNL